MVATILSHLVLFCTFIFCSVLTNSPNYLMYPFYLVNFGVHELAHLATHGLPDLVIAMSGSISEILLAFLLVAGAVSARYYFAAAMSFVWVMFSFFEVGSYMADARAQELDLVSIASATGCQRSD